MKNGFYIICRERSRPFPTLRAFPTSRTFPTSIIIVCFLALLAAAALTPSPALAAPGDLIWKQDETATKNGSITSIVVDSTGVYSAGGAMSFGTSYVCNLVSNSRYYYWRIQKRNLSDGNLIWEQETTQRKSSYAPRNDTLVSDIVIDGTGVYVAGTDPDYCGAGTNKWRIQKRNLTDGNLIWEQVGSSSSALENDVNDEAIYIAVDSTGVYVATYATGGSPTVWSLQKLNLSDGSLIWGPVSLSFPYNSWSGGMAEIAVDSTGVYVVGATDAFNGIWNIQKNSLADGSLIWEATNIFSLLYEPLIVDTAIDTTGIYLGGQYGNLDLSPSVYRQWFTQKRSLTDGSSLWEQKWQDPPAHDYQWSIAVDDTGVYGCGKKSKNLCGTGFSYGSVEGRDLGDGSLTWERYACASVDATASEAIAVDSSGVYVAGYGWYIEKREKSSPPPPLPTVNLSAFPTTINSGESTTLSWTTTDATSCDDVPLPEWLAGPVGTSGSEVEWPTATTTYTISCTGPGGTTQQSTTVTVNATCGEGSLTWTQTYNSGGTQNDYGYSVAVDSGNNIYIAGYQGTNGNDMFLRKYDSSGVFQWAQIYNSSGTQVDYGYGVAVDSGSNIYVSGYQDTTANVFLRKYDSSGAFQWMQTYNSGLTITENSIAIDLGNNVYITGKQTTNGGDMFLRKYDSAGNFQWMQTYNSGGTLNDWGYGVATDSGNNIYVTGYRGTNGSDMFLRKYDSAGNFQWMQIYNSGGTQIDYGYGVAIDSGNNVYVSGYQQTNGTDMFLRKYDSSGNFQWMQTYNSGGTGFDYGNGVAVDAGNNVYVTGRQQTNGGDMFLRKYDSSGNFQWMQTYNSAGTQRDDGYGVTVDSANNINIVGRQQTNGYDAVLWQYDGSGCGFTPAPTVNLSANPSTINSGEYSDLTWSSTNAVSCAAVYPVGWTSQTGTSGTERLYPASTTIYTILCTGAGGTTYQATTVTVNAPPAGNDCGLRMFDGTSTIILDCETPASTTSLRIHNNGTTSGIKLVDPSDPNASRIRIAVPDGGGGTVIKALRKQ